MEIRTALITGGSGYLGSHLSKALKKAGFDIDRKSLKIKDEPIKEVGTFEAEANLHKGVKPVFKFEVVGE